MWEILKTLNQLHFAYFGPSALAGIPLIPNNFFGCHPGIQGTLAKVEMATRSKADGWDALALPMGL